MPIYTASYIAMRTCMHCLSCIVQLRSYRYTYVTTIGEMIMRHFLQLAMQETLIYV